MSRKKKPLLSNIKVDAYAAEGKSIARLDDGKILFIENVIPGDIINVQVIKVKKNWSVGRVTELIAPSPDRLMPFCQHFGVCGGCKWQMLPYHLQLQYKQQQVTDQLQRIGQVDLPEVKPIIGSQRERQYRNKLEFTFSMHRYRTHEEIKAAGDEVFPIEPALGFHAPGLFDKVVPIFTCYLQADPTNTLLSVLRKYFREHKLPYYDYRLQSGYLRNVIIRVATTGEVLVNLVVHHETPGLKPMLDHVLANVPGITSLHYTINPKANDTINDLDVHCYFGKPYIEERLENFVFKISPKSFFQTNTYQAEALYKTVRDFAGLTGNEVLYDLYCGTGSIGIFCSKGAKKIIGIELIDDAVKDAYENALMNGLDNCEFFAGDAASICTGEFFDQHGRPDVIITDPPRAGMHEKLIDQLLILAVQRVVYVSCNPATQARDLKLLDSVYKVTRLQPLDMFPHTHHIENVALLELK